MTCSLQIPGTLRWHRLTQTRQCDEKLRIKETDSCNSLQRESSTRGDETPEPSLSLSLSACLLFSYSLHLSTLPYNSFHFFPIFSLLSIIHWISWGRKQEPAGDVRPSMCVF